MASCETRRNGGGTTKTKPLSAIARLRALVAAVAFAGAIVVAVWGVRASAAEDPLASWNGTETKQAIVEFVDAVTDPASPSFVAPDRRIATFDNEGTLWVSHPIYTQFQYVFDRIRRLAPEHPEWRHKRDYSGPVD